MNDFIFAPPAVVSSPVDGETRRYAIRRIFCVGRNYEAHAKEMGVAVDSEAPFYFTKSRDAYVTSGSTVAYPPGTGNYHYEIELVVAIGRAGFRIAREEALSHVFGYACGLDMTRRDLQLAAREHRRPWDLGKDVEQSAVMSSLVPSARIGHPDKGNIELRVNGATRQNSDIDDLIHKVPNLIAHLSQFYHLAPGDLIYTGTPEGVGPVVAGDIIEGSIAGVGMIRLVVGPAE